MDVAALHPSHLFRYAAQAALLAVLATGITLALTLGPEARAGLSLLPWRWAPAWLLLVGIACSCNATRVWLLARALGHPLRVRQCLAVVACAEFGMTATPAGTGGAFIYLTLLRRAGLPLPATASLLAADVSADLICLALVGVLAALVVRFDPTWQAIVPAPQLSPGCLTAAVALAAAVAGLLWLLRRPLRHWATTAETRFCQRSRVARRLRQLRREAREGVQRMLTITRFLFRERRCVLILNTGLAALQWLCRFSILPAIMVAVGAPVNPLPLYLLQGLLFLFSLLVFVPGGGGSVELLAPLVLRSLVPEANVGAVLVLWRLFTFHLYLFGGGAALLWTVRNLQRWFPRAPAPVPSASPFRRERLHPPASANRFAASASGAR